MPSLPDSIVIFVLALLLFGPKKLPVLARELGKWIGEFRRASNEFKMQMEEELRLSEQAEREQKIAAMEAAAPPAALPRASAEEPAPPADPETSASEAPAATSTSEPLPIASSGDLNLMPPSTGLPTPRSAAAPAPEPASDLAPLLDSIPEAPEPPPPPDRHRPLHETPEAQETPVHG